MQMKPSDLIHWNLSKASGNSRNVSLYNLRSGHNNAFLEQQQREKNMENST